MPQAITRAKLDHMMQMLADLLMCSDISEEVAVTALRHGFSSGSSAPRASDSIADADPLPKETKMLIAHMVSLWSQNPEFCDAMGRSIPLPRNGPMPSLQAVYELAVAERSGRAPTSFDEAFERLMAAGTIERREDCLYYRTLDYFLANTRTGRSAPALFDYAIDYVHTSRHNIRYGGSADGHFQRVAETPDFPANKVPKINQMMEEHGMDFLKLVDGFITDEARESNPPAENAVNVGVGLYLYVR